MNSMKLSSLTSIRPMTCLMILNVQGVQPTACRVWNLASLNATGVQPRHRTMHVMRTLTLHSWLASATPRSCPRVRWLALFSTRYFSVLVFVLLISIRWRTLNSKSVWYLNHENQDSKPISLNVPAAREKYDDIEKDVDNLTYVKDALDELKLFMQYKMGNFLPTINNPTISLGIIDENGKPQDPLLQFPHQ